MSNQLYLDDLAVGQRFTSATHPIDTAQIKAFAAQFDPQPFHLDEQAAATSLFAGLAASGWHTTDVPCASWSRAARRSPRASSALEPNRLAEADPPRRRAAGGERSAGD